MTIERNKHIYTVIKKAYSLGVGVIPQSLFYSGGTIDANELSEYINHFVSIGFCQPKFYTRQAWSCATNLMRIGIKLGFIESHDYGYQKGKYRITKKHDHLKISEISGLIFEAIK